MDHQHQNLGTTPNPEQNLAAPQAATTPPDMSRPVAPSTEGTEQEHVDSAGQGRAVSLPQNETETWLTVKETVARWKASHNLIRDEKSVQRYCAKGSIICNLDPDTGSYFIAQLSADEYAAYLLEVAAKRRQGGATPSDTAERVVATPNDTPSKEQGETVKPMEAALQEAQNANQKFLQEEISRLHEAMVNMREDAKHMRADKDTHLADLRTELEKKQVTIDSLLSNQRDDRNLFQQIMDRFIVIGSDTEKIQTLQDGGLGSVGHDRRSHQPTGHEQT